MTEAEDFDLLVTDYLPRIYGYLLRLTHDPQLAEDLAQETFIRAWKNLRHFRAGQPFKPWLFRIAHNTAVDALRRRHVSNFSDLSLPETKQVLDIADVQPEPPQAAAAEEDIRFVEQLLSQLNEVEREVIILHYLEQLSVTEIAAVTARPLETIRTRLRRARASLRQLADFEPAGPTDRVLHNTSSNYAPTRPITITEPPAEPSSS